MLLSLSIYILYFSGIFCHVEFVLYFGISYIKIVYKVHKDSMSTPCLKLDYYLVSDHMMDIGVGVTKMGNTVPQAGLEPTSHYPHVSMWLFASESLFYLRTPLAHIDFHIIGYQLSSI